MITLTTTQYSALGDLTRFGYLTPGRAEDRGTPSGFSRRTLDALVAAGSARWDGGRIVPVRPTPPLDITFVHRAPSFKRYRVRRHEGVDRDVIYRAVLEHAGETPGRLFGHSFVDDLDGSLLVSLHTD